MTTLLFIRKIFRDFGIITLEKDHLAPGVFLKARKPENYVPTDLSGIALYSMILGRRTRNIPKIKDMALSRQFTLKLLRSKVSWLLPKAFIGFLERLYLY